jgi:hypothetical protein
MYIACNKRPVYTNTYSSFLVNRLSQEELDLIVSKLNKMADYSSSGLRVTQIITVMVSLAAVGLFVFTSTISIYTDATGYLEYHGFSYTFLLGLLLLFVALNMTIFLHVCQRRKAMKYFTLELALYLNSLNDLYSARKLQFYAGPSPFYQGPFMGRRGRFLLLPTVVIASCLPVAEQFFYTGFVADSRLPPPPPPPQSENRHSTYIIGPAR